MVIFLLAVRERGPKDAPPTGNFVVTGTGLSTAFPGVVPCGRALRKGNANQPFTLTGAKRAGNAGRAYNPGGKVSQNWQSSREDFPRVGKPEPLLHGFPDVYQPEAAARPGDSFVRTAGWEEACLLGRLRFLLAFLSRRERIPTGSCQCHAQEIRHHVLAPVPPGAPGRSRTPTDSALALTWP